MRARALLLVLVAAGACYSPDLPRCVVTCGSDSPCPADLSCEADHYCHDSSDTSACHAIVTVTIDGDGLVESNPAGLSCTPFTSPCTEEFTPGSSIVLTASSFSGETFAEWTGDTCAGFTEPTCTFGLEISLSLTATFR
ncbi:MAG TPA: hypothetical protein VGL61_04980 [Kofleriaceae bacterium]|jgi:hypothetical protein